jgi:MraZ protein
MFRGTFEHAIDDKGRVNVPARFRDVLRASEDDRLFITNFFVHNVRCLDVYPYAAWLQLEARLREKPQFDPSVISFFQNYYLPGAQECLIDRQGRVLIPPRLREYANLKKDVVFTGALDKFRLWDREAWQPVFSTGEQSLMNNPNILSAIGI